MSENKLSAKDFIVADGAVVRIEAEQGRWMNVYFAPPSLAVNGGAFSAKERASLAEGVAMGIQGLLDEILERVRAEEREACAKIPDDARETAFGDARQIRDAILARGGR